MRRLVVGVALVLAGCGYDGSYRYPCQDPENWGAEECVPPACLVDGACTEDLLGFDPYLTMTTVDVATDTEPEPVEVAP
jgi:hypothetical protein